jgi:outer membrane murein-binding lipoprotein Lpp
MTTVYKWLATLLAVLAVVGIIYGKGRLDSAHKAELASVTDQLTEAKQLRSLEQAARSADNGLAKAQATRLYQLSSDIDGLNAYVDALQDADRECLTGADTDKLRQLWQ